MRPDAYSTLTVAYPELLGVSQVPFPLKGNPLTPPFRPGALGLSAVPHSFC